MPAAIAFRSSDSQLEPRFIFELQEHVKHAKCYLTHGLEGLDVGIFLHKNKVLKFGQRCRWHRPKKRPPWDSCAPAI